MVKYLTGQSSTELTENADLNDDNRFNSVDLILLKNKLI